MAEASTPLETAGFLLSKIGQEVTRRFAEALEPLGIRPKHCGLLAAAAARPQQSQHELGLALGLVPSAIVTMVDDLEAIGALRRDADPDSRRRYVIELTRRGHALLARATAIGREVDEASLANLSAAERGALDRALGTIAATLGLGVAVSAATAPRAARRRT